MTAPEEEAGEKAGPLRDRGVRTETEDTDAADGTPAMEERRALESAKTAGELRDIAQREEARRKERFRDIVARCRVGAVLLGFGFTVLLATGYVLHLVLPEPWHWLAEDQLDEIKSFVVGVVGALLLNQVRKGLSD